MNIANAVKSTYGAILSQNESTDWIEQFVSFFSNLTGSLLEVLLKLNREKILRNVRNSLIIH